VKTSKLLSAFPPTRFAFVAKAILWPSSLIERADHRVERVGASVSCLRFEPSASTTKRFRRPLGFIPTGFDVERNATRFADPHNTAALTDPALTAGSFVSWDRFDPSVCITKTSGLASWFDPSGFERDTKAIHCPLSLTETVFGRFDTPFGKLVSCSAAPLTASKRKTWWRWPGLVPSGSALELE
jgi:hypothetical protein